MKQLAVIKFLSAATIVCATDLPITQEELVRRTQELYDAVVPGNQVPWKKYFADDCIFADEKGRVFDKPKLIADDGNSTLVKRCQRFSLYTEAASCSSAGMVTSE